MENQRLMTCPHCKSEIPYGAHVCRGCKAEIDYGTPLWAGVMVFVVGLIGGYFSDLYLHKLIPVDAVSYAVWAIVSVILWFVFGKLCNQYFDDDIRFKRFYIRK